MSGSAHSGDGHFCSYIPYLPKQRLESQTFVCLHRNPIVVAILRAVDVRSPTQNAYRPDHSRAIALQTEYLNSVYLVCRDRMQRSAGISSFRWVSPRRRTQYMANWQTSAHDHSHLFKWNGNLNFRCSVCLPTH